MSKIVAVYGSPREQGNSSILGRAVIDGAMGLSLNTIYLHRLNNLNLQGCQFCNRCKESGVCCLKDDVSPILEDIRMCDSLVLCFPLFFCGPSAQMKVLIDRMYSFIDANRKPKYPGKKLVLIITYDKNESADVVSVVEAQMRDLFSNVLGFDLKGFLIYKCEHDVIAAANDVAMINLSKKIGENL